MDKQVSMTIDSINQRGEEQMTSPNQLQTMEQKPRMPYMEIVKDASNPMYSTHNE